MMTNGNHAVANDPVLFWAEPDPAALWRGAAVVLLLMAPLAILAPAGFIAAGLTSLLLRKLNQRSFRFELSARELRLKLNFLTPTLRVKLNEIASVNVMPDAAGGFIPLAPRSGHLVVARTDGARILVPGLKDAAEAAEAVKRLKHQAAESEQLREAA